MSARRIHTAAPRRREFMLDTYNQMDKTAQRLAKLGYFYVIGWRDVRGFGVCAVQFPEWYKEGMAPYVNLRFS